MAGPLAHIFGLTPARYDLMFHLFTRRSPGGRLVGEATQAELRRALGVSRETVRRMLVGLEERGYVERHPIPEWHRDRRSKIVELTALGQKMIRGATKLLFPDGVFTEHFVNRREPLERLFITASSREVVARLALETRTLARTLLDFATLEYPDFDPDD